jgi:hypothetical protein
MKYDWIRDWCRKSTHRKLRELRQANDCAKETDTNMPRPMSVMACAFALANCSSLSRFDQFTQPDPATLTINSSPPGAEAHLSTGGACRTPCIHFVSATNDLTVTYALDGYVSQTVPVRFIPSIRSPLLDVTPPSFDPNPVTVILEPAPTPPQPKPAPVKMRLRRQAPPADPMLAPLIR